MNTAPAQGQGASFPLALARTGEEITITGIRGGKGLNRKLVERGLRPGVSVTVVQKRGGGFVLARDSQRIALGTGMAQKIFVSFPDQVSDRNFEGGDE